MEIHSWDPDDDPAERSAPRPLIPRAALLLLPAFCLLAFARFNGGKAERAQRLLTEGISRETLLEVTLLAIVSSLIFLGVCGMFVRAHVHTVSHHPLTRRFCPYHDMNYCRATSAAIGIVMAIPDLAGAWGVFEDPLMALFVGICSATAGAAGYKIGTTALHA